MFYMYYKRVFQFFYAFQHKMGPWTKEQLYFDGVKIVSAETDKLLTYFDYYTADLSNAFDVDYETKENVRTNTYFKVQVPRLNHIPFDVRVKYTSNKEQKAVLAMFVGPKYDSYGNLLDINDNRYNFWELERFTVDLKSGENVITRKSTDFTWFVKDRTTYFELYKSLMTAMNGGEKFPLDMSEAHCGFPSR
jgi:hypothetical protein